MSRRKEAALARTSENMEEGAVFGLHGGREKRDNALASTLLQRLGGALSIWTPSVPGAIPVTADDYPFDSAHYRELERRVCALVPSFVLPNHLTLFRVVACIFLFWYSPSLSNTAFIALAVAAGISDFLDGALARARNRKSRFGIILDPAADKLLVGAVLFILLSRAVVDLPLVLAMLAGEAHLVLVPAVSVFFRFGRKGRRLVRMKPEEGIRPSIFGKAKMHLYLFGLMFLTAGMAMGNRPLSDAGGWMVATGVGCAWVAVVIYVRRYVKGRGQA